MWELNRYSGRLGCPNDEQIINQTTICLDLAENICGTLVNYNLGHVMSVGSGLFSAGFAIPPIHSIYSKYKSCFFKSEANDVTPDIEEGDVTKLEEKSEVLETIITPSA